VERKPYNQRTDLEKCQSQWTKLRGLHSLEEWSGAIVRAATAAEIAANFAIREEFKNRAQLSSAFVDSLLRWANGLQGKIDRLLVPLTKGSDRARSIKKLRKISEEINFVRNAIVHRGEFRNKDEAVDCIESTRRFIETLVRHYSPDFELVDKRNDPTD
jgi:hypothetical protein